MTISFPYRIDATGRTATPIDVSAHVRELIEQVLFTAPGERVMRPTFGSAIHQLVFAPASPELMGIAEHLVRSGLQQWLHDWIELQEVRVEADGATITVTVAYLLRRTGARELATVTRSV